MNNIDIYNKAIANVPAYRKFLQEKVGKIPIVETQEDFETLPFMTKSDYIMQYPVPELCIGGTSEGSHIWLRSSGTSKKPFFWPRRYEDEKNMSRGVSKLFQRYVTVDQQPVLMVVGLALGPWGTGMQCSYMFRTVAHDVPGLAVVSPGLQNENIIEVLERLSPMYKKTLLFCYPPFAKMVLEEAAQRGIDLAALNLDLMVGGEGITETYRESMWKLLGRTERDLNSIWCLYGSTDFANVGFENALTIAVRRILVKNNLCNKVLGEPDVPMIFQRIPNKTHFEIVDGELVVTRFQGIPLIRYKSGDHLKFIPRDEMLARLLDLGFDAEQVVRDAGIPVPEFKTPFAALYGRIDQVVFFYGAKITVDQVKAALEAPELKPYYNGRFLMRGTENNNGYPMLEISLEENSNLNQTDLELIAELFANALDKVQSEFREVRKLSPDQKHVNILPQPAEKFELGWKTRHM